MEEKEKDEVIEMIIGYLGQGYSEKDAEYTLQYCLRLVKYLLTAHHIFGEMVTKGIQFKIVEVALPLALHYFFSEVTTQKDLAATMKAYQNTFLEVWTDRIRAQENSQAWHEDD